MPVTYPMQNVGRYRLGIALTYKLIHDKFGFDLGERYHLDLDQRIRTTMEIDRAVFDTYGEIGLGYEEPFPRASIEPFGHRFLPAMFGCETDEIREELLRLMQQAERFPAFSFTLLEVDARLGGGLIFEFYETFRQCAGIIERANT